MKYGLLILIISAAVLRLVNINQSLWLDEGISIQVAKNYSYLSIINTFSPGDFHPPLFYLGIKFIMTIFGYSEITARLLSVISGILTVPLVFILAKKLYGKQTAFVASALVSTSPLLIYYSQEARMYSLATFLSTGALYFFIRILINDDLWSWLGFIVFTVLTFYSDYMPVFVMPAYFLFLIIYRNKYKKISFKSFFPAFLLIIAVFAPWILIFTKQLGVGLNLSSTSPLWSTIIGGSSVKDLLIIFPKFVVGRISFQNDLTYFLTFLPVGIFIVFLLLVSLIRLNTPRIFLWFYLVIPVIFSFTVSFFIPIFSYFRLIFVLPVLYILIASAICNLNWSKPKNALFALMLLINIISLSVYFTNPKFQREDWRSATKFVVDNSTEDSIAIFESNYVIPPFDYYNEGRTPSLGALETFNPNQQSVSQKLTNELAEKKKIFLFQYLAPISDPQGLVFNSLVNQNFVNTDTKDFRGVGFVYVFSKR